MVINKIEKEIIKAAIEEGGIYINRLNPIGEFCTYSPIKPIYLKKGSLKHGSESTS